MDVYIIQRQMLLARSNFMKLRRTVEQTTPRTGGCPHLKLQPPAGDLKVPWGVAIFEGSRSPRGEITDFMLGEKVGGGGA